MNEADQREIIQLLKDSLEQYKANNEYLKKQNEEQQNQIQQLTQTIVNLNETVENLKNKIFGFSSEKTRQKTNDVIPEQQNFFNEVEAYVDPTVKELTLDEVLPVPTNGKPRKKKAIREELLAKLPVVEVLCTLLDEDKICPYCDTKMNQMAKKFVREEIRITPRESGTYSLHAGSLELSTM